MKEGGNISMWSKGEGMGSGGAREGLGFDGGKSFMMADVEKGLPVGREDAKLHVPCVGW